ncbi:MAG: hypothetical protein ACLFUM_09990 [Spirochaetaceae bacterium]
MTEREDLTAEELVVLILKKRREMEQRGERPERVVLSMANYRKILDYHAHLGELPARHIDYITRDTIFNLPVYIDEGTPCDVD